MPEQHSGPASQVLLASVARRYYLFVQSKVQIGDELGLSRFQVARMLQRALLTGLVRIEIGGDSGWFDLDTSSRLLDAYGLRHAVVVDVPGDPAVTTGPGRRRAAHGDRHPVGRPGCRLGARGQRHGRGRHVAAARPRRAADQGAVGTGIEHSAVELVRGLARVSGGPAHFFYAPMIVRDATTAAALRTQPEVERTLAMFYAVTNAVVGMGSGSRPGRRCTTRPVQPTVGSCTSSARAPSRPAPCSRRTGHQCIPR